MENITNRKSLFVNISNTNNCYVSKDLALLLNIEDNNYVVFSTDKDKLYMSLSKVETQVGYRVYVYVKSLAGHRNCGSIVYMFKKVLRMSIKDGKYLIDDTIYIDIDGIRYYELRREEKGS